MGKCVFCELMGTEFVESYSSGVAMITPLNPVVDGHKLFIHQRHTKDAKHDPHITGIVFREASIYAKSRKEDCNLIVNVGEDAGQTVFHLHVHYVPRMANDGLKLPWSDQIIKKEAN